MSTFKKIFKYDENIVTNGNVSDDKKANNERIEETKIEIEKNDKKANNERIEETKIETYKNDEKYEFTNDPFFFT